MPRERIGLQDHRDRGSVTIAVLAVVIILFALAAGVTQLSTVTMRAGVENDLNMRVFYLADSGAQVANSMIQASDGTIPSTTFVETLNGGTVSVNVAADALGYIVTSTATLKGEQGIVEMRVKVTNSGFAMQGAAEVIVDPGVRIKEDAPLPVGILGTSKISGMDHAVDGTLLVNQTGATRGLAVTPVPGGIDWTITQDVGATLEGSPTVSTNQANDQSEHINALLAYSKVNADVTITGPATLGDIHTGSYGTALVPKLVYVRMGEEQTLTLGQGFTGYGTLFIDIEESEDAPALVMQNTASWHGPVIVRWRDEAEVDGSSLIIFRDSAKVIGGVTIHLSGEEVDIDGLGNIMETSMAAQILYSSATMGSAPGFSAISPRILEVVSYRSL